MGDKEKTLALIFGLLTLLAIINWFILVMIKISRGFFWLSLTGIFLSLIFFVYFIIAYFRDEENLFDLEDESGLIVLLSLGAIIFFYFFAGACYNVGYSENAIKTEMESRQYLQEYNTIINLPNQAIEETIDSLCQDPNYPCQNTKQAYAIYKQVSGLKSIADNFSKILVTAKKVDKTLN